LVAVAAIMVLKFIPSNINAAAKAKELEMEKIVLNAKLAESRISTMMSQIRPHFIYNTLGSIEQLCKLDPPKASDLAHNFAKYLRGNFGELDKAKDYPTVASFTDSSEMLDSGLVDAALIAVPHYDHPTIAIECFKRGIHVLTEKPAGVYARQVREMNEAAEKSGVKFGIMFNQRTNPMYAKAREIVRSGELGELKRMVWIITNWCRTQAYYNSGSWRATWNGEGGGVLLNQAPLEKYLDELCRNEKYSKK